MISQGKPAVTFKELEKEAEDELEAMELAKDTNETKEKIAELKKTVKRWLACTGCNFCSLSFSFC